MIGNFAPTIIAKSIAIKYIHSCNDSKQLYAMEQYLELFYNRYANYSFCITQVKLEFDKKKKELIN